MFEKYQLPEPLQKYLEVPEFKRFPLIQKMRFDLLQQLVRIEPVDELPEV
jgi:hypothetical protein